MLAILLANVSNGMGGETPRLYAVSRKALGAVATRPCVLLTTAKLRGNKGLS